MPDADVIIVGSGLAGLHAACPLVESGLRVRMLDAGIDGAAALERGPARSFDDCRRHDPGQHAIFLGDDLSGINAYSARAGHRETMMSGRRSFVVRRAAELLPVAAEDVLVNQSLAKGGLSEAWGAVSSFFTPEECRAAGIEGYLRDPYAAVVKRIGVSGPAGACPLQPPADLDDTHAELAATYRRAEQAFQKRTGFTLEQPPLALLTQDAGGRSATAYRDMDFWDNIGRSVYRGHYTLEELQAAPGFLFCGDQLVSRVRDEGSSVVVEAQNLSSGERRLYRARSVVLAAGAINTTRILLRSFERYDEAVPFFLKNHYLVTSLYPRRLGRSGRARRHSLCQLMLTSLATHDGMAEMIAQLYSYKSLLLHKLLPYQPLPAPEALRALALLTPALVVADVRFASSLDDAGTLRLRRAAGGGEYLEAAHVFSDTKRSAQRAGVARVKRALRALGLIPLATATAPFGVTSHYAGGIPFAERASARLSANARGQVHGSPNLFVADSATWTALPAKPPSLTLMANALRVGANVLSYLGARPESRGV
ncbi:MAG: GMC family oxidoreductase [Patescibacteria group bacterium]|nr:hypothetical protein [Patescibacteria group bacterium]MDE1943991.1 GMC family oxidoreductase [Patescibacteria group bacterium]MDE1945061.1 GMC family oxidoreductase [Patescibacteria group bacterium]MDE2057705.1 GMC family oxidoreductase [Patescibacteria group bacterium]